MATSANQQGVVGADSGAIWMWTEACVILRGYSPFKMTVCFVDLLRRHLFLSFYNASPLLSTFFLISPAWCYLVAQLVGLVISLLPRKQAMQARARKQERIRHKKGSKANLAPAWWAGVMIIGTTLPQEIWSAQDVVKLYRVRWQIELLFKRLKQGLQLHLLPVKLWERAQAYVHLCLIVWSLQEQEAQARVFAACGALERTGGWPARRASCRRARTTDLGDQSLGTGSL